MYKLREYQQEAVDKILWHFENYNKPFVVQAATGAGKSLIIADVCHSIDSPVLILQPSKELLEQNYSKLKSYGIDDIAIYSASMKTKEIGKYTYATIGSIYKKPELFAHFKYVIIDECHQVNPKNLGGMYTTFLNAIGCTNVCGLTATPYRLQQKYFNENGQLYYTSHLKMINRIHPFFWKNIIYKIETQELIEKGYLCPIKYRGDDIDWDQLEVNTTGADFTSESMEKFWNDARLEKLAKTIQFIDKHCTRNLVFCSSLRAADRAQQLLTALGVQAHVVSSKTDSRARSELVDGFKKGDYKHLINVGVFTTGFDVPELDSIVLARPTMSLALYYQMVGRGVRIDPANPSKILRVFDLAGCVTKLGRVETIRLDKDPPPNQYKDRVVSEVGEMTERPLFKFRVKKTVFKKGGK
jgi:DNA repair protein RadD